MTATAQLHPPLSALLAVALDQAHPAVAASVEAHIGACDACWQRHVDLRMDLAQLTLALEPQPLPPMLREGIMQAAGEIHRLFDAAAPLARALQIPRSQAHDVLLRLDAPRYWQHTPTGWRLDLPESGLKGAHILRLQAGERWSCPSEGKQGIRVLMVLQGRAIDAAERSFSAAPQSGDLPLGTGPSGALLVQPGADLLLLLAEQPPERRANHRPTQGSELPPLALN